jgi:hypothetical protein
METKVLEAGTALGSKKARLEVLKTRSNYYSFDINRNGSKFP